MSDDKPVKVYTYKQLRFDAPYTRTIRKDVKDEYDNRRYARVEDVERMVREAWKEAWKEALDVCFNEQRVSDTYTKVYKKSQTAARLRAMKEK